MSRTKRKVPRDVGVNRGKTLADILSEWSDVYRGSHHAHEIYRWNKRLGRDGGYHSGVYPPYTHAPNFIDRWREDALHKPSVKRVWKRELAQLIRRDGKAKISLALLDLGEDLV